MKEKRIIKIVEDRFKAINKLQHKIIKKFDADDVHDFRVEVKKLRAFLRLLDAEKEMEKPLIPRLLKTFYGYVGIIRNIQLHRHNIFKYITDYKIEEPKAYIQILDDEKSYWEKEAVELMADNSFKDSEDKIVKQLPRKLEKSTAKKFLEKNLGELKEQLNNVKDDNAIHTVRKILKDILYTLDFINHDDLPKSISKEEDLKLLTTQLGNFRDKCIQLEFLSDEYLNKVLDEKERHMLLKMKEQFLREKQIMVEQLSPILKNMREEI
jgi:CHAD domain-containing protein